MFILGLLWVLLVELILLLAITVVKLPRIPHHTRSLSHYHGNKEHISYEGVYLSLFPKGLLHNRFCAGRFDVHLLTFDWRCVDVGFSCVCYILSTENLVISLRKQKLSMRQTNLTWMLGSI